VVRVHRGPTPSDSSPPRAPGPFLGVYLCYESKCPGDGCSRQAGGDNVRRFIAAAVVGLAAFAPAANASAATWTFVGTNQVASSPTSGGGYPVPSGSRVPDAGTCRSGPFNANHSESWLAVKPDSENLVGSSKFFFDKFSTFYMFYLGAYRILNGTATGNNQIQGYECVSTGTQDMPPSWTDTTDPNVDFDTKGRVYQTILPFNAFWERRSCTRTARSMCLLATT